MVTISKRIDIEIKNVRHFDKILRYSKTAHQFENYSCIQNYSLIFLNVQKLLTKFSNCSEISKQLSIPICSGTRKLFMHFTNICEFQNLFPKFRKWLSIQKMIITFIKNLQFYKISANSKLVQGLENVSPSVPKWVSWF